MGALQDYPLLFIDMVFRKKKEMLNISFFVECDLVIRWGNFTVLVIPV